jgi:hypothetical protein
MTDYKNRPSNMQFRNNKIHRNKQNKNSRLGVFKAPARIQQVSK